MRSTITGLVIAGALVTMLGGSALEAAAQTQPIVACVMPGTGLLRIPPGDGVCKPEERSLSFGDLPLLVALQTQVQGLQAQVQQLEEQVMELQERLEQLEKCTSCSPE